MRKEMLSHIVFLAELDSRIWLLTADLGHGVLDEFREKFPERFLNVGVAEQNMMGVAAGLARCGKIPFVYSMSNFVTMRCLEQIRNDISYPLLPVRILSVGGGYTYGSAGYSHHGLEDLAVMRAMPYMNICVPTTSEELWEVAQRTSFDDAYPMYPMYIRLPRESYEHEQRAHIDSDEYADYDVVILTYGDAYKKATEVSKRLEGLGMKALVETGVTIRPFKRTGLFYTDTPLVVIEEHTEFGGIASEYLDMMSSKGGRCLAYGLMPQHIAGSCEELTNDMFNVEDMSAEIAEWVSKYDNG